MMYGEKSTERVDRSKTKSRQNAWEKAWEFAAVCGEWREEADYLLEHRPRERGAQPKFSMAARYQDYENLLTRKKHNLKTQHEKKLESNPLNGPAVGRGFFSI